MVKRYFILFTVLLACSIHEGRAQDTEHFKAMIEAYDCRPVLEASKEQKKNGLVRFPMYPEGFPGLMNDTKSRLVYPKDAKKEKIEGVVILDYVISRRGDIGNVRVLQGVTPSINKEAVRVMQSTGPWIPGISKGTYQAMRLSMQIEFKLK